MRAIQLVHDKALKYPNLKNLVEISIKLLSESKCDYFITFRNIPKSMQSDSINGLNACSRFINLFDGDIVFYGLETDSCLAPCILWDTAHTLSVGSTITMAGDYCALHYYEREYFTKAFEIVSKDVNSIKFKKIAKLPVELQKGLEDWTFGIPVGGGDASILNAVVKRILEIDVPRKEIILCGRPDNNFKYWDRVKVVGEDIPAPPVQISRKKNTIVKAASHNNICIIHDRVFLPSDFGQAMRAYGDYYSFTGLQSLYFDDYNNMIPLRYSDFQTTGNSLPVGEVSGILESKAQPELGNVSFLAKDLFSFFLQTRNFFYANTIYHSYSSYLTGSLYIIKKAAWECCPQNESLRWEEYEDVEQGARSNTGGIPHRINPYTFTQSFFARNAVVFFGNSMVIRSDGQTSFSSKPIFRICRHKRKPLYKITSDKYIENLNIFASKYCSCDGAPLIIPPSTDKPMNRFDIIVELISKSEFAFTPKGIHEYFDDIGKYIYMGEINPVFRKYLIGVFLEHRQNAKADLAQSMNVVSHILLTKIRKDTFYKDNSDFFVKRGGILLKAGSILSALYFTRVHKDYLYHPDGLKGYYRGIMNSTPFVGYLDGDDI